MKANEDVIKRWGMRKKKPVEQKPGKVLVFPQVRLCPDCKQGKMEEVNLPSMTDLLICRACGSLQDITK
jgi:hypothetical protein